MKFENAFKLMKQGVKVKLPSWSGYWTWDDNKETILMHTKESMILDIRETERVEYTLTNIISNQWEEATEENCELLGGSTKFGFDEAIRQLKKGRAVRRLGWNGKEQFITLNNIRYWDRNKEADSEDNTVFVFHGTLGKQLGWLASQGDMLADDWTYA